MTQPQDKDPGHAGDPERVPERGRESWVTAQLRDKIQRIGAAAAKARHAGDGQVPGRRADRLLPDLEAEL